MRGTADNRARRGSRGRSGQADWRSARSALGFFLFEGVDQLDRREEADPLSMMLDGLDAQCRGDMGLAGARTADQHDIVGDVDKVAAVKLPDQRLIDLAAGKVEAGEIAIGREPRHLELIGYGPPLPFGGLSLEGLRGERNSSFRRGSP